MNGEHQIAELTKQLEAERAKVAKAIPALTEAANTFESMFAEAMRLRKVKPAVSLNGLAALCNDALAVLQAPEED